MSEEDFNEIQRLTGATKSPLVINRRRTYYPLREMIKCSSCGRSMSPGASKSRAGTRYLYYRCTNVDCTRKKKSIRAIEVFNSIYMLWEGGVELTEKDYQYYYDNLTGQADKRRLELRTGINSKEAALKAAKRRSKNIALKIIDYKQDSQVWKINNDQLSKLDDERKDLKKQIKDLRVELNDPEQELLSIEQFLNLAKNVGSKVKAADEVGEYHICRIIFLNLVVDDKSLLQIGKGSRCLKWSADSYFNRTCFSNSIRSANLLQATSKTI